MTEADRRVVDVPKATVTMTTGRCVEREPAPPEPAGQYSAAAGEATEARDIELVARRLIAEFTPALPADVVGDCLEQAVAEFTNAPVRRYVPLLVERRVRQLLRRAAARRQVATAQAQDVEAVPDSADRAAMTPSTA